MILHCIEYLDNSIKRPCVIYPAPGYDARGDLSLVLFCCTLHSAEVWVGQGLVREVPEKGESGEKGEEGRQAESLDLPGQELLCEAPLPDLPSSKYANMQEAMDWNSRRHSWECF